MTGGSEEARSSLCVVPRQPAYDYHYLSIEADVWQEILTEIDRVASTPIVAASMTGEVLNRLRRAARGELTIDPQEFVPVRRDPDLWEIKWKFRGMQEFRLYHAEPASTPDLVALRFHLKEIDGLTPDEIEERQEAEMDLASSRYGAHATRRWGHRRRSCDNCLRC